MKRLLFLIVALHVFSCGFSQSVAVGDRAPELRVRQWLTPAPAEGRRVKLIEFYSSANPVCVSRLQLLDSLAARHSDRLSVILVVKDGLGSDVDLKAARYSVAQDSDMRIFRAFGIRFVPSGVIVDMRGKVLWVGNTSAINERTIKQWIYDDPDKDRALRK